MKEFFNEYGWLVVYGVIILLVISSLVPAFTESVSTAITQFVSGLAEHVDGLITSL